MNNPRKIIHIDMDAFYASVELKDRPELRGLPMIVAGDHPRSVVTTATYEARQFGLHSAMPVSQAKKRCPHVVCIPPDFAKYRAVSQQLHEIFNRYTHQIEPISLDEAYLDVTHNLKNLPSATAVAEQIRQDIFTETGLTASAGIAPNKFIAKIASDWNKPNGLCVVKPSQVLQFIHDLPLEKIPGVGRVTLQKMHHLNWHRIADIQSVAEPTLIHYFGKFGKRLFLYAQAIDDRPVETERERQQISNEITFEQDYYLEQITATWSMLADKVWQQLKRKKLCAKGVTIKLKTSEFKTLQHSRSFSHTLENRQHFQLAIEQLLPHFYCHQRRLQFRLAGVGVFALEEEFQDIQMSLLNDHD